jgi:hypothetical protein
VTLPQRPPTLTRNVTQNAVEWGDVMEKMSCAMSAEALPTGSSEENPMTKYFFGGNFGGMTRRVTCTYRRRLCGETREPPAASAEDHIWHATHTTKMIRILPLRECRKCSFDKLPHDGQINSTVSECHGGQHGLLRNEARRHLNLQNYTFYSYKYNPLNSKDSISYMSQPDGRLYTPLS